MKKLSLKVDTYITGIFAISWWWTKWLSILYSNMHKSSHKIISRCSFKV